MDKRTVITTQRLLICLGALASCLIIVCAQDVTFKVDKVPYTVMPPPFSRDHVKQKCWNFTFGDWQNMEFYSPHFPHKYTNNTECVHMLSAPDGYIVELDFRDKFVIEGRQSECKYDYLEVRDGPYAYSPMIGRYCGRTFPQLIESNENYMWIKFRSDDILEYSGFRAVFQFKRTSSYGFRRTRASKIPACRIPLFIGDMDGNLSTSEIPTSIMERIYNQGANTPIDCTWEINVPANYRIGVVTKKFQVLDLNDCSNNFLEVYDGTSLPRDQLQQQCGGGRVGFVRSRTNKLYVRIYGKKAKFLPEVEMVYTAFKQGRCSPPRHSCGEGMCIHQTLVCNGVANCEDRSDEHDCVNGAKSTGKPIIAPTHAIILGAIGGVFLTVVLLSICVTCQQRRREKNKSGKAKDGTCPHQNGHERKGSKAHSRTCPRRSSERSPTSGSLSNGVIPSHRHQSISMSPPGSPGAHSHHYVGQHPGYNGGTIRAEIHRSQSQAQPHQQQPFRHVPQRSGSVTGEGKSPSVEGKSPSEMDISEQMSDSGNYKRFQITDYFSTEDPDRMIPSPVPSVASRNSEVFFNRYNHSPKSPDRLRYYGRSPVTHDGLMHSPGHLSGNNSLNKHFLTIPGRFQAKNSPTALSPLNVPLPPPPYADDSRISSFRGDTLPPEEPLVWYRHNQQS